MSKVQASGKTLEEAIRLAMIKLDADENQIQYKVIEEGSKGFLGIGAKEIVIEAEKKNSAETIAEDFLRKIFQHMGMDCELKVEPTEEEIKIEITGSDLAILIGKHGQTLDALQYLTNIAVNRNSDEYVRVSIDIEGYREKRKEALESLAFRLASRVRKSKKSIVLEPMNPYERRIIHSYMHDEMNIGTRSEGVEPDRRIVIYFDHRKKNNAE